MIDTLHNKAVYILDRCSSLRMAAQVVAETCRSTFVNKIFVQLVMNWFI